MRLRRLHQINLYWWARWTAQLLGVGYYYYCYYYHYSPWLSILGRCALQGAEKLCQWAHYSCHLVFYLFKWIRWMWHSADRSAGYTVENNNQTVPNLCVKISWLLLYSLLHVWGWAQSMLVLMPSSSLMAQKWGPVEIMLSFNFKVITSQIKHCKTNCCWLCVLVCPLLPLCL